MSTTDSNDPTAKITDRIAKLLAKAEGTDNEAEAATFMAAVQRLMTQHAIDEAMIRSAGTRSRDEIITKVFEAGTRTWWRTDLNLMGNIASANSCRYYGTQPPKRGKGNGQITVIGYAEDIANVEMIYASLQVQLARFLRGTPSDQAWRRAFRYGFSEQIGKRLAEARAHIIEEMSADEPSLVPMLLDKDAAVAAAMPSGLRESRGRAGFAGYGAGVRAGNRADVGGPAVPTGLRAIGAGSR